MIHHIKPGTFGQLVDMGLVVLRGTTDEAGLRTLMRADGEKMCHAFLAALQSLVPDGEQIVVDDFEGLARDARHTIRDWYAA